MRSRSRHIRRAFMRKSWRRKHATTVCGHRHLSSSASQAALSQATCGSPPLPSSSYTAGAPSSAGSGGASMSSREAIAKSKECQGGMRRSRAVPLKVARCPDAVDPMPRYRCTHCPKEFAFEAARRVHEARHERNPHNCHVCLRLFPREKELMDHEERHFRENLPICLECGDEFLGESGLRHHMSKEEHIHSSSRQHMEFSSAQDINHHFQFPTPVNGNSLVHATNHRNAEAISDQRLLVGYQAGRPHDGFARRDDAPKLVFFSVTDVLYTVTRHPVFSEPGELVGSFAISLDMLVRTPGEYRLYFMACMPPDGHKFDDAILRVTVMFAKKEHWAWCSQQDNVFELDIFDNSVLRCVRDEASGENKWEMTSHYLSKELGLKTARVIVAVAGDQIDLAEEESVQYFESSRLFQNESKLTCPSCLKTFKHQGDLYRHLRFFTGFSPLFLEDGSERQSSSTRVPEMSEPEHDTSDCASSDSTHASYPCPLESCDKVYDRRWSLFRHMHSHTSVNPHACSICEKSFRSRRMLVLHQITHSDERPYACRVDPNCTKTYKRDNARCAHERTHREDTPVYECSYDGCSFSTQQLSNFKTHSNLVHSDERPYACSYCSKSFKVLETLRDHENIHTGRRPYMCRRDKSCTAAFRNRPARERHEREHDGEEVTRIPCTLCNETFTSRKGVANHMRTHKLSAT